MKKFFFGFFLFSFHRIPWANIIFAHYILELISRKSSVLTVALGRKNATLLCYITTRQPVSSFVFVLRFALDCRRNLRMRLIWGYIWLGVETHGQALDEATWP
ncbi:hypothetical protein B0T25DRAFT_286408 [Lasiosphaeria hispida]|uniref:Uncharacterized protein n=1 Tax=Lasiosphaeria hispida TaxID=260671 RepID=A0AAJ0HBV3_9PEZI|nr:hypothetical protein B0T25DRAFT_286408 [Lasiosphaeria hispida]